MYSHDAESQALAQPRTLLSAGHRHSLLSALGLAALTSFLLLLILLISPVHTNIALLELGSEGSPRDTLRIGLLSVCQRQGGAEMCCTASSVTLAWVALTPLRYDLQQRSPWTFDVSLIIIGMCLFGMAMVGHAAVIFSERREMALTSRSSMPCLDSRQTRHTLWTFVAIETLALGLGALVIGAVQLRDKVTQLVTSINAVVANQAFYDNAKVSSSGWTALWTSSIIVGMALLIVPVLLYAQQPVVFARDTPLVDVNQLMHRKRTGDNRDDLAASSSIDHSASRKLAASQTRPAEAPTARLADQLQQLAAARSQSAPELDCRAGNMGQPPPLPVSLLTRTRPPTQTSAGAIVSERATQATASQDSPPIYELTPAAREPSLSISTLESMSPRRRRAMSRAWQAISADLGIA